MGNKGEHDGWIGPTLRQTPRTAPDECPDTETLASWVDGGLSAKAASAVELHASSCSRCMAVLAAMERSAPAAAAGHAWTPMRAFRWLAPLTAAAAAVAIWIAVPDRPITPVAPSSARDSSVQLIPENREPRALNSEPGTQNQNPAPSTQNSESQKQVQQRADEEPLAVRDELRRERAAPETFGAPAAAPSADAAVAAPAAERSTNKVAEINATTARRSALDSMTQPTESVSPSNALIRWRIAESKSIERSTDGGKTWIRTTSPAPSMTVIRAVDSARAVATSSDGAGFYTTNGGLSWTRVQEDSAAPF